LKNLGILGKDRMSKNYILSDKGWKYIQMLLCGVFALFAFCDCTLYAQAGEKANSDVLHLSTPGGVAFGLWGDDSQKAPAPILFVLANTIDGTLGDPYFRQCGNELAKRYGYLCVSIDLPGHGRFTSDATVPGLEGWAESVLSGRDFVAENNARMREVLDFLILEKYADPEKIFAAGTSRGGYLALQFAASEERVKSVISFAPVTKLAALKEFQDVDPGFLKGTLDLSQKIRTLAKKNIWITIGDQDDRVGTDHAVDLARRISLEVKRMSTGSNVELQVISEPRGHTTPKGAVERSVEWMLELYPTSTTMSWDSMTRPNVYEPMVELFEASPQSKKDIVFLGNSITFWGDWKLLTGSRRVVNRGIPGDITYGVLERLQAVLDGRPSKVFVLIGVNDISHGIPDSLVLKNYERLLDRFQEQSPGTKVYMQSILPVNDILNKKSSIFNRVDNIQNINEKMKAMVRERKSVEYIDLYSEFEDKTGKMDARYTWDGVHLNMIGYKKWAAFLKTNKYL